MENFTQKNTPDESSIFTEIFVEKLRMGLYFQYNHFNQRFETAITRGYSSNESKFRIDSLNLTIITSTFDIEVKFGDRFIQEEICDHTDHSLVRVFINYHQYGLVTTLHKYQFTKFKPNSSETD